METTEIIKEILEKLEEGISYEDFNVIEEARKELFFLLEDLESDFPATFDEDY